MFVIGSTLHSIINQLPYIFNIQCTVDSFLIYFNLKKLFKIFQNNLIYIANATAKFQLKIKY